MTAENPNWDKEVKLSEDKYLNALWQRVGRISSETNLVTAHSGLDEECEEVLNLVAEEKNRIDPNGERAIDQEEVWRAAGRYIIYRDDTGKKTDRSG